MTTAAKQPNIDFRDVLLRIEAYKTAAFKTAKGSAYSKRIMLGKRTDIIPAVCSATGAAFGLLAPSVLNKTVEWDSPFASYDVCRGIVQEGPELLNKQDASILSALFITMASHYGLLRAWPSATGAEKNALLRTAERAQIIDALLFIETCVNNNNAQWLPALSLIPDTQEQTIGLAPRFAGWLKAVSVSFFTPDVRSYEEATAVRRTISVKKAPKTTNVNATQVAAKKAFKEWKKQAKGDIGTLFTSKFISLKLKNYLLSLLSEEALEAADGAFIGLLCAKLNDIPSVLAEQLALQINKFHKSFSVNLDLEALEAEDSGFGPSFASMPIGSTLADDKAVAAEGDGHDGPDNELESDNQSASAEPADAEADNAVQENAVAEVPVASTNRIRSFAEIKAAKLARRAAENN